MKEPNVKIYVATHEPNNYLKSIPYSYYIPIHCGKAIYEKERYGNDYIPLLGDDTGDNISNRNKNYCELTALYWIWKNDNSEPNDIVGLNHYRRYLSETKLNKDNLSVEKTFPYLLTKNTLIKILNKYDFIVRDGGNLNNNNYGDIDNSIYKGYKECHVIKDMDNALIAIKKIFPNYFSIIEKEIKHNDAMCSCNVFITKKKYLDEYCEFLFPILSFVDSKINYNEKPYTDGYQSRALGFLSERLFRPWLIASGHSAIDGIQLNFIDKMR